MRRDHRNILLWTVRILLAVISLLAGAVKLGMPAAELTEQSPFSVDFLRFIGFAEVIGALGLVLPSMLGIRHSLTQLAAAGLGIIMIGATVSTIATGAIAGAPVSCVLGLLAFCVAWNADRVTALPPRTPTPPRHVRLYRERLMRSQAVAVWA